MKRDLLQGEPVSEAKVHIKRIKQLNWDSYLLRGQQTSWLLRSERHSCSCCAESDRKRAASMQPDIDKLDAQKQEHLEWLAANAPIYCARLERIKLWIVTSDGVMSMHPIRSSRKHPLIA